MSVFLRNVAFHGILLDALFEPGNPDWRKVYDLVSEGIKTGVVQPLQTSVFDREDIENAFRFMAQGKHVGKQLLTHVTQQAKDSGSDKLLLNVNKYNQATRFYERFGFQVIAEEVIDIGNGFVMDDYVMELRL